jgi:hypothetical protein
MVVYTKPPNRESCVGSLHDLSRVLENHAEELGVVKLEDKTYVLVLMWAFVFGFAEQSLRHSYNCTTEERILRGFITG